MKGAVDSGLLEVYDRNRAELEEVLQDQLVPRRLRLVAGLEVVARDLFHRNEVAVVITCAVTPSIVMGMCSYGVYSYGV